MTTNYNGYVLDAQGNAMPISDPNAVTRAEFEAYKAAAIPPVGIVLPFWNDTEPAAIWGGTWELTASGRTLIGAGTADSGTVYTLGQLLGEETVVLYENNMPWSTVIVGNKGAGYGLTDRIPLSAGTWGYSNLNDTLGNEYMQDYDVPHNNMQPSEVVNWWKRIA